MDSGSEQPAQKRLRTTPSVAKVDDESAYILDRLRQELIGLKIKLRELFRIQGLPFPFTSLWVPKDKLELPLTSETGDVINAMIEKQSHLVQVFFTFMQRAARFSALSLHFISVRERCFHLPTIMTRFRKMNSRDI